MLPKDIWNCFVEGRVDNVRMVRKVKPRKTAMARKPQKRVIRNLKKRPMKLAKMVMATAKKSVNRIRMRKKNLSLIPKRTFSAF